jgi:Phage Mu protein F like protein
VRHLDTLAIAHEALAAAIAAAAIKAHIPGDVPEDHEDNDYGLPEGVPIRRKLRAFFREQLKHVVGVVAKIGAEIPHVFPRMADYNDAMSSAMTPILGVYWDKAGRGLRGRLGLDPQDWRVTDPNIHRAVQGQAIKFCRATNATTDLGIADARDAVRDQLARGLIGQGDTIDQLTGRMKQVFTRASTSRARMIAQTEASRAVHDASLLSAEQSGVVAGKRWLLSANSCPVCHRLAAAVNSMPLQALPLDGEFGRVGNDPDFSGVKGPPAHPHCRCSLLYVLDEGGSAPAFVPSPKKKR